MPEGLSLGCGSMTSLAGGVWRKSTGDRARDERGALLVQPLYQRQLFRHQRVDLRRLAVEEVSDGGLFLTCRSELEQGIPGQARSAD